MSWLSSVRARARLLFRGDEAEDRMDEEMRFHLEMEADRLAREEGLDATEARRRARVVFGAQDVYREQMREGRGLGWLSGLRLDLKLGGRMLVKYPVLTIASALALAIAVALAASWFEFMTDMVRPRLPVPGADRLVALQNLDEAGGGPQRRSLHDFETWRDEAESIEHVTALAPIEPTLTTEEGRVGGVEGARATPSMFRLAAVRPLLGRVLEEGDDRPGAPLVAVIGYDLWQRLFDGDRTAIGATLRLGSENATVVGVMPEGFGFPVNAEIWVPLRERAVMYARGEGPPIRVLGRLAPGASLERARAELETIGARAAAEFPATDARLRPRVARFPGTSDMALPTIGINLPFLLFLVVVSANVATLLFARTASRQSEIALRNALGASRRRLIAQLVAEAVVLTSLGAALGLVGAHFGLRWGMDLFWEVQQMRPPFWWDAGLSSTTVLYAAVLALVGATIIGGIPGLRATRAELRTRLPQPGAGGSGMKFGRFATGVIVVQVALSVAFIPVAIRQSRALLPERGETAAFPAEEWLSFRLTRPVDDVGAGDGDDLFDEAHRRLAAEPGVLAVTRTSRLPGFNHPIDNLRVEGDSTNNWSRRVGVDPDFFDAVGARIVNGRGFRPEDVGSAVHVAIVHEAWAQSTFGGRNPVGRRFTYDTNAEDPETWYEVVGLVAGTENAFGPGEPVGIFHPLRSSSLSSVQVYVRTDGIPDALIPRVQEIAAGVDPDLGVADAMGLDAVWAPIERSDRFFAAALGVVGAIIVLFALIGIYALMSFTVAQRAREIGIRAALGAEPRRIITSIFSRAMLQIGFGIVLGAVLVSLTVANDPEGRRLVGAVAAAMVVVGLMGCALPALRALRIQPTEALRAE